MWRLRIEQYFQVQDYALWDVIENGNSFKLVAQTTTNADGTLTSLIPDPYKDAKTLFAAIQTRFGDNEATKKTQKTFFEANISIEFWEVSLLSRNTHVVFWRNKPDLDTMSFNDLYNNFKIIKQEVKGTASSSSSSSSHNMAFVSSPSSTNEVNTAYGVSTANTQISHASTQVSTTSTQVSTTNLSDDTVYAFLASQSNGSQLVYEDLEKIHKDDIEEMDLKWQLAMLSMRTRRFFQKTGRKITINGNGSNTVGYDKSRVECFNCHKMRHFTRECKGPRNQGSRNRNQDSSRKTVNVEETSSKSMVAIDGAGFDWSYMADVEVPTNMALMAFSDSEVHNDKTCSKTCLKSFETLKTQLDDLRIEFNKSELNLATYKRGLASVKEQLVFYKKNEELVSDDKLEKKTIFPTIAKIEFVRPKQQEKLVRKPVKYAEMYRLTAITIKGKGNMVPRAVLMKSGLRSLNTVRPITTAYPKTTVYSARPMSYFSKSAQSTVKSPYQTRTTLTNKNISQKVNTAKGKFYTARQKAVNTARPNSAVVNAMRENQVNAVKASTCWVWRPTKLNSASITLKRHNYVDARGRSKCDNGTEFKNRVMSEFCKQKGIKREFSIARTPQQNSVAERRNRTLIEVARTMLADSKLLTTFWAEAVNTACYVQNRVLVVKPHNKTPYELFRGRTPALSFMRPFRFLEDKLIIAGDGPKWLFDIDVLTKLMNYVPVVASTNSNDLVDGLLFDSSLKNASNDELQPSSDAEKKDNEGVCKESGIVDKKKPEKSTQGVNTVGQSINTELDMFSLEDNVIATHADFFGDETEVDMSNITTTYPVLSTPNTRIHKDHSLDHVIGDVQFGVLTRIMTKTTNKQGFISAVYEGKTHKDLHTCLFACFLSQEEPKKIIQTLKDLSWIEAMQEELL
ncbi:putative ribonuclease H-like domain-containing protein [Tanacetum coccineum]